MNFREAFYRLIQILTILSFVAVVVLVFLFLRQLPPPPTNPENIATLFYLDENFEQAAEILRPIARENPDRLEANYIFAMSLLRTQRRLEAEKVFRRLYELYPRNVDVQLGLADTLLALRRYDQAIPIYENLVEQNPRRGAYRLLLGEAYYEAGENMKAAETFRYMIERNMDRNRAIERFKALYGLPEYDPEMPLGFGVYEKPDQTLMNFRTQKDFIEVKEGETWKPVFLKGLNLTATPPGYYVSDPPREYHFYEEWLTKIADMNCNVVRLYTLAAPAFYHALKAHNERSEKKLWLLQEVWLHVRDHRFQAIEEAFDLYDPEWEKEFMQEIMDAVDAIHGQGNVVKRRRGSTGGIFTADVSPYVVGIALGKELETYIALETNEANPEETSFAGQYIGMEKGNPTEAWFARMCDFTAYYQMTHYNSQCPLSVVNAPQLDPMEHPSAASFEEQHAWEELYGIPKFPFQRFSFENDVVELDIQRFCTTSLFPAGLFACYHSYPHWPDFMWADWKYQIAEDEEGPNPFYGHVVELKDYHKNFPLVMGEYGVSTSWYSVYSTINSINQGGYTEEEQAEILERWTNNLFDTKYAGAIVFEFQDEWWHPSVVIFDFQEPVTRRLWFNVIDAASNYGVETYIPLQPTPLLSGEKRQWRRAKRMASSRFFTRRKPGDLKRIYTTSDFAFLYVRLDVEPFEEAGWDGHHYSIALSTYPGKFGSHLLPESGLNLEAGANFLVELEENQPARLLIAKNYNPHEWQSAHPLLGGRTLTRKYEELSGIDFQAPFEEILIPTQPYHIGRDGTIYQEMYTNMSELRYGTADYTKSDFNHLAAWHYDKENGMIEIRIPWMLLFVTDPPRREVLLKLVPGWDPFRSLSIRTPGIGIVAVSIDSEGEIESLPKNDQGFISIESMPLYTWEKWNSIPPYESRFKKSYFTLERLFKNLNLPANVHGVFSQ